MVIIRHKSLCLAREAIRHKTDALGDLRHIRNDLLHHHLMARQSLLATTGLVVSVWGCGIGDNPVQPAQPDPGPLHVQFTVPPQARDIGAMLVVEGPGIDSLKRSRVRTHPG